jgi:hypothetical protein
LRRGRSSSLIWSAVFGALALVTKQNSVYLPLFCLFSISALRKWHLLRRRAAVPALAIIVCLTAPYYYVLYRLQWSLIAPDVLEGKTTGIHRLTYYWRAVPELIGLPLLWLGVVGLLTCVWWNRKENNLVFLSWIFSVYVTMTAIGHKESRYIIYMVPAVIYFTIWPVLLPKVAHRLWLQIPAIAALAGAMAYTVWTAWLFERPFVIGYATVAREIRGLADSGVILVDVPIPGNLIFFVRAQDPMRRFVVLRKSLYSLRSKESLGGENYIRTNEELRDLLRQNGIRFIVVSNKPPENFAIEASMRELLETPQFRLVGRYPIEGNSSEWSHSYLSLYENLESGPPTLTSLRIPMLTMDHGIEVSFEELGITPASHLPLH